MGSTSTMKLLAAALALTLGSTTSVMAAEYPIGKQQIMNGLEVAAVYLQPIKMDPEGMMRKSELSDIHVEADIRAVKDNPNGFAEGDWMPNLVISYQFSKVGSKEVIKGDMMPMVANDGPHYGDNVKLAGPGKYTLIMKISPPSADTASHFGRHVDKETGVGAWFKPFEVKNDFVFAGVGKKGGY